MKATKQYFPRYALNVLWGGENYNSFHELTFKALLRCAIKTELRKSGLAQQ